MSPVIMKVSVRYKMDAFALREKPYVNLTVVVKTTVLIHSQDVNVKMVKIVKRKISVCASDLKENVILIAVKAVSLLKIKHILLIAQKKEVQCVKMFNCKQNYKGKKFLLEGLLYVIV